MSVRVQAVTRQTEGDDRETRVGEEESQRGEERRQMEQRERSHQICLEDICLLEFKFIVKLQEFVLRTLQQSRKNEKHRSYRI